MNKTHKRATEKHRAKAAKFELRRKEGADPTGAKVRSAQAAVPTGRQKSAVPAK